MFNSTSNYGDFVSHIVLMVIGDISALTKKDIGSLWILGGSTRPEHVLRSCPGICQPPPARGIRELAMGASGWLVNGVPESISQLLGNFSDRLSHLAAVLVLGMCQPPSEAMIASACFGPQLPRL